MNTAKLLDFDLDDKAFTDFSEQSEEYLINVLKTLSESQKEWLVWNLNGIAYVTGKATEAEVGAAVNICNRMGITDDRYISIIQKTKNIMNRM